MLPGGAQLASDPLPEVLHDGVRFAVFAGLFLRIDQLAVQLHLEDPAPRGNQDNLSQGVFELFEYPLRQTDGSRRVPSLSAVLDRDLHRNSLLGPVA